MNLIGEETGSRSRVTADRLRGVRQKRKSDQVQVLKRATSSEPSATFHFMFLRSLARFCSSLSINFTHCRQEVYSERSREKEAAPQRTQSYMVKVTRATVCDVI